MATFTIDDKEVEIVPGKNVLQTAVDNDIFVPHYCFHSGLSAPANCRMCLVEIEMDDRRGLMPSCTAMPAEGMIVDTLSEGVKRNQEAVMEFLLINHPLDCPVCDQAGECGLQNLSYSYGPDRSRFYEEKTVQPKKDIGDNVMLYSDRCIRCTRCIRFCDEVSGTSELGYFNRGVHNEIDVFPGERMDNRMSGNTVDICPVGALLDKKFQFKQRVWFLENVDTICPGCSTGCNVRVDMNRERIYRMVPRENLDVNDYWMCDDGRYGWGYVHKEDRLLFPLKGRASEDLMLWSAALDEVKLGLEKVVEAHGSAAVAGIASGHLTNEEQYLFGTLFRGPLADGSVALRSTINEEGDVGFKSGFTIRADKSPNMRGGQEILSGLGIAVAEAADVWREIEQGNIKALYYAGGIPFDQLTESEKKALDGLEFLIVQDTLANSWTHAADVVLPTATFIEQDGTFTNHAGRVQQIRRGLEPVGDARAGWEILRDVIVRMGGDCAFESAQDVLGEIVKEISSFESVNVEVGDGGVALAMAEG